MQKDISILGCGWLGLPLAEYFISKGITVHGSTTSPEKLELLAAKNIKPYLLDLKTLGNSPENLVFFQSEILIINIPPKRNSGIAYATQVQELCSILKNTPVKKVIFVSSTSVYAPSFSEITEAGKLEENIAQDLIEAEKSISSPENPWQTTILRFAGLFGPDRAPGRFLAGKSNLPDSDSPVNLIHLQDCIRIIAEIIGQDKWKEIFNACADEHPTRKEFYTQAARKLNLPEPTFAVENGTLKPKKLISNAKLKAALNYQFLYPDPLQAL